MKKLVFQNDVLPLKDAIFRLALRITLNRQEAEDITQETLMRVWQERDQWNQIQNMEAWCLTVGRRLALDHVRRNQIRTNNEATITSEQLSTIRSTSEAPDDALDRQQRVAAVRNVIDTLPEVQRTIIELRDIEDMRYDEIAQVTGLNETQVKVYLHRARKKIREML